MLSANSDSPKLLLYLRDCMVCYVQFFQGSFYPLCLHAAVEAKLHAIEIEADTKARALAGQDFKQYEFKGRRRRGCALRLQMPLSQGPEPRGLSRLETLSAIKSH